MFFVFRSSFCFCHFLQNWRSLFLSQGTGKDYEDHRKHKTNKLLIQTAQMTLTALFTHILYLYLLTVLLEISQMVIIHSLHYLVIFSFLVILFVINKKLKFHPRTPGPGIVAVIGRQGIFILTILDRYCIMLPSTVGLTHTEKTLNKSQNTAKFDNVMKLSLK